jgi:hypothetical protein
MKRTILLYLSVVSVLLSCDKGTTGSAGGSIEIYRLRFAPPSTGPCTNLVNSGQLAESPLIANDDILWYKKNDFEFRVKDAVGDRLRELKDNEQLAVTLNKTVIYYCLNKPLISSSICPNSISMGHLFSHTLYMTLVTGSVGAQIDDARNDIRLLSALANQGKLR